MSLFRQRISLFIVLAIYVWSCRPEEEIITSDINARLTFSENAVVFDTLFTGLESITRRLTVYNPNKKALIIDNIYLGNQYDSPYEILINGRSVTETPSLRLLGGDSLLVLVKVLIRPRNDTLPFIEYDSLSFQTNGNIQNVKLLAWGQDAHFIRYKDFVSVCDITWESGKPYVLIDSIVVKPGCTLTVKSGSQVYSYSNAHIIIEGTLLVQGTPQNPVLFADFQKLKENAPGQWGGIIFGPASAGNQIFSAEIRNATTGLDVRIADADTLPDLIVESSLIKNMLQAGIRTFNSDVTLANTILTNCISTLFAGQAGGNYSFRHCTLANYNYDFSRELPAVFLSNTSRTPEREISNPLTWKLHNTIIWGNLPEEILLAINQTSAPFSISASYNVLKTQQNDSFRGSNNLLNVNPIPLFADPAILDFRPAPLSPLIDAGTDVGIQYDITGKKRDTSPDIGAFEL